MKMFYYDKHKSKRLFMLIIFPDQSDKIGMQILRFLKLFSTFGAKKINI